jgi:hypothetical protein
MEQHEYANYLLDRRYTSRGAHCAAERLYTEAKKELHTMLDWQDVSGLLHYLPVLDEKDRSSLVRSMILEGRGKFYDSNTIAKYALLHAELWKEFVPPECGQRVIDGVLSAAEHTYHPLEYTAPLSRHFDLIGTLRISDESRKKAWHILSAKDALVSPLGLQGHLPLPAHWGIDDDPIESPAVTSVRGIDNFTPHCFEAEELYEKTLTPGPSHCSGSCTLVMIEGSKKPVAAIKWNGEKSMLGLQLVRAPDGSYPIIPGGLYGVDGAIQTRAISYQNRNKGMGKMFITSLEAMPLRMLGINAKQGKKNPAYYAALAQTFVKNLSADACIQTKNALLPEHDSGRRS